MGFLNYEGAVKCLGDALQAGNETSVWYYMASRIIFMMFFFVIQPSFVPILLREHKTTNTYAIIPFRNSIYSVEVKVGHF